MNKETAKHAKGSWRRWAKETRAQLDRPVLSRTIIRQLELWPLYQRAQHILTYLAFGNEIDLAKLYSRHPGKQFYTTRTCKDGTLSVHRLSTILERHPYGFLQPAADSPKIELEKLELLLIPGLAFDTSGNRLGYGRGFYDRLLAQTGGVPVVGVAPAGLIVSALPSEPHDVKMTHLLSEKGVLEIAS